MAGDRDRTGNTREHRVDGHLADVRLVEAIQAGSEIAWHTFIDRYAKLISHVARRYLFDEDDVADVLAGVLESLHGGRFEAYRGRSSLATWLIIVSRNAAADTLRKRFGRREIPRGLRDLSTEHHEVFRIFYVEGATFTATLKEMRLQDPSYTHERLVAALQTIGDRVSDRTLKRISYDLAAPSVGAASGRLLEFCESVRHDAANGPPDPLDDLVHREAEARALEALKLVAQLPPEEQKILSLRFDEGLQAREIANRLGYPGQRKVFTVIDRILRRLKRMHARDQEASEAELRKIE